MATGRVPTTANSPLTAKGDLFTYSTAPARLAVGNNGESLVADSSTSTGLRYQGNFAAGKNKIINGDFGIWQRGTSFTPALNTFLADRYKTYMEGSGTTRSVTQQTFTAGTAPVAGYEGRFFMRYAQTVGPSAAIGNNLIWQSIEDVRTFAGQTVTISFWAKAAATTVLDSVYAFQTFGTGGSPSGNVQTFFANNLSIGTSWTRYSFTAAIPSIAGKTIGTNNDSSLDMRINFPLGSGNTFTVDTWGWQMEASNTATAFQTATGTLQGELAACQRYYERFLPNTGSGVGYSGIGHYYTTTVCYVVQNWQTKRTIPTITVSGATDFTANSAGANRTSTAVGTDAITLWGMDYTITTAATTLGASAVAGINAVAGWIGVSAEL